MDAQDAVSRMLNPSERIVWKGAPVFLPHLLSSGAKLLVLAALMLLVPLGILVLAAMAGSPEGILLGRYVDFFMVAVYCVLGVSFLAYKVLRYRSTQYVITDRRVVVQGGVLYTQAASVELQQMQSAGVIVSIFDKIAGKGTGTVLLYLKGRSAAEGAPAAVVLENVPEPYAVLKSIRA